MTMLVRPSRFKAGADTAIGLYLGDEQRGLAIDFTTMEAVVRDDDAPVGSFYGTPSALLTNTTPPTKLLWDIAGVLVSGSNMRTEYHPTTHVPMGLLVEEQRINVVLHNRDATNVAWVKTNVTAAKDQTGLDGVANSASSLLATAANGTCLQAITLVSAARFQTAYVKRLVGSGTVQMTMDNGTTWTTVTVTADWTRVSIPTQTLANPTVGFRIVTSGDSIAVDLVQNENGVYATSPIVVSTTAATRVRDNITLTGASLPLVPSIGTLLVEFAVTTITQPTGSIVNFGRTASGEQSRCDIYYGLTLMNTTLKDATAAVAGSFANYGSLVAGTTMKIAVTWADNDFALCRNNIAALTDLAGTAPATYDKMFFGANYVTSAGALHIRRVKYLPRRTPNAELQAMTA
jgi:hypothetical protein